MARAKRTKPMGFANKASIAVQCQQLTYLAGEIVRGSITLDVQDAITCDAVVLHAIGQERIAWTEEVATRLADRLSEPEREVEPMTVQDPIVESHESKHVFFTHTLTIRTTNSPIAAAEHTFPFEFELPTDLPGSFHLTSFAENGVRDLSAHIEFKLMASLEMEGWSASDLESSTQITVHSRHAGAAKPTEQSVTEQVGFLCCLIRGTCHVRFGMDKDTYHFEDIAQIQCHVANNSFVDVNYLRCFLWQDLTLELNEQTRRFSRQMSWAMFPGVKAGSILHVPQGMKIHAQADQGDMNATTKGKLIQCTYRVEMECSIPLCPDVILQLPVTVVADDSNVVALSGA